MGQRGKKIRASLTLATGFGYGVEKEHLLPVAGAIEMIHAFLWCMMTFLVWTMMITVEEPSMHRAFGEAMAVLTGDALLIEGYGS